MSNILNLLVQLGRRGAEAHELHPALHAAPRRCRQLLRFERRLPPDLRCFLNYQ